MNWPELPEGATGEQAGEPLVLEGPALDALLGFPAPRRCGICGEMVIPDGDLMDGVIHKLNGAGRVMHVPEDALLGLGDADPGDPLWWLSFCDPGRPEGSQFLGVAIVQAPTMPAALTRSHAIGVNPGGEAVFAGPIPADRIGPQWRDRLLSREEAEAVPEPDGLTT